MLGIIFDRYDAAHFAAAEYNNKESPLTMQNSTATVFRAVVMLGCLIAIPAAALLGTSLPEIVDSLVSVRNNESLSPAKERLSEAPKYESTVQPTTLSFAAGTPIGNVSQSQFTSGPSSPRVGPLQSPTTSVAHHVAAARSTNTSPSYPVTPYPSSTRLVPLQVADNTGSPSRTMPVDYQTTASPSTQVKSAVATQSATSTDRFTYIQQRLRQLGATYYLLEAWGNEGHLYRFYCKMSVGGSPHYNRHFEATDANALQAMSKVLADVETWRKVDRSQSVPRGRQP